MARYISLFAMGDAGFVDHHQSQGSLFRFPVLSLGQDCDIKGGRRSIHKIPMGLPECLVIHVQDNGLFYLSFAIMAKTGLCSL